MFQTGLVEKMETLMYVQKLIFGKS